jgi:spore cortex formation protein SpoVR/YcgB (stage V sporulation)
VLIGSTNIQKYKLVNKLPGNNAIQTMMGKFLALQEKQEDARYEERQKRKKEEERQERQKRKEEERQEDKDNFMETINQIKSTLHDAFKPT